MSNERKIGTYFKKENIFLGTLVRTCTTSDEIQEVFNAIGFETDSIAEDMFKTIAMSGAAEVEEPDIFYKDKNGYTRFFMEGNDTIVGDNSDGKGVLKNLIPVWDYYSEDKLCETVNDEGESVIVDCDDYALDKYNTDYNLQPQKRQTNK